MRFKDFLRRVIGGRSHSQRLAIFRKFERYSVRNSANADYYYPKNITDDEIENIVIETVERLSKDGVSETDYKSLGFFILHWRNDVHEGQRRESAKKRWHKGRKPLAKKLRNRK